nr:EAL domain-containing protein [uncultured Roseobacter sp.]
MYRVIECLSQEHDHWLVAVAAIVCVIGSCISVLVSRRLFSATGLRRRIQLFLSSLISGATVWSTHFIAMLAYEPGFEHGYEPVLTGVSLGVAVFGMLAANALLAYGDGKFHFIAAGAGFGLSVSMMHYIGMSAYLLPGVIRWDPSMVLMSLLLGCLLGAAAYHRIAYPITRYCWLGGAVLMVLAICSMHFTGMAAFSVELSPYHEVPQQFMPDATLGLLIFAVTILILVVGFAALSIETNLEREALEKLEYTATHDHLTKLPNRLQLSRKMDECKELMSRDQNLKVAVLTIDLDLFKEVNDLRGHAVGDRFLKEISNRLKTACQEHEFVARTGGDEFVALKVGFQSMEEVVSFAERLHALTSEPVDTEEYSLSIGSSIGIATSISDGSDLDDLQHNSDLAMYRAKLQTEANICIYDAEMDRQSRDRLLLINDLRQVTSSSQLELAFQLQNDLKTLEPIGFEVLLRWNHPTRGIVSPAEFIPIAEETGLIREIGMWVLRAACFEAAKWSKPLSVAVNVAPQQLAQPSFIEELSDILIESRLPPGRLELEVTESSIIDDQAYTLKVMHKIKAMGVRIAMDDFGTGYSSLAALQAFPFDKIKIDRSFIQDVNQDRYRTAIVRSTLLLGEALGIPVLAEGVENEQELSFLQAENCDFVQGFLFGKPMSLQDVQEFVCPDAAVRAIQAQS